MKIQYRLKFRQSTGFLSSLFLLMGKGGVPVPDYTTLNRRQKSLSVEISDRLERGGDLSVEIDSTGLKVYGEGEWKVRKHGWSRHRAWRKLHVCIDLSTQEILSVELTGNGEDDASAGAGMLKNRTRRVGRFSGDGAYDKFDFREVLGTEVVQIIPPPKNAVVQKAKRNKPLPDYLCQRNLAVEYIRRHGPKSWKEKPQ